MGYYIYARSRDIPPTYTLVQNVRLFRRNSEILRLLTLAGIPAGQGEPWKWELNIRDAFAREGHPDWSFIIDLRPSSKDFEFYELLEVYGYTHNGSTPYLLRLRSVLNRYDTHEARPPESFPIDEDEFKKPICTVAHFRDARVDNGELKGKWDVPGVGATNSTLVWPEEWDYFCQCNRKPLGP